MSSPDDARPEGPPPGDVAPTESEPSGAEVEQPPAAADDPRGDEPTSDSQGTGVVAEGPQQDADPATPEGTGTAEPKPEGSTPGGGAGAADDQAEATTPSQPDEQPAQAGEGVAADAAEAEKDAEVGVPTAEDAEPTPPPFDERRSPLLEKVCEKLGDAVVATELIPGRDVWVRVRLDAWAETARVLRDELGFTYFCFLSAIDWMPSPFGKSEDDSAPAEVDPAGPFEHGVTGGETRFQLFARVETPGSGVGITVKADVGDDLVAPTWTGTYAGANWHERETYEMFGITFEGHPMLVNLYLPGDFEGRPLRKDFPLLSRMVKPWPGLVDVEPMPGEDVEEAEAAE